MNFFSTFLPKCLEVIKKAVSLQRFREIRRTKFTEVMKGRLAQLVQSICLTSRGSAVRIRQRPLNKKSVSRKINGLFFYITFIHHLLFDRGTEINLSIENLPGPVIYININTTK